MTDDFFRNRLDNLIYPRHGLAKLTRLLPLDALSQAIEQNLARRAGAQVPGPEGRCRTGRPSLFKPLPLATWLMVGLHYLFCSEVLTLVDKI